MNFTAASIKNMIKRQIVKAPMNWMVKKIPISQMFINDEEISTQYGISNFPSFLDPKNAIDAECEAVLYNENGRMVFRKNLEMNKFETLQVDFSKMLKRAELPKLGLAVFNVVPRGGIFFQYPILWHIKSHFFCFFLNKRGGVCGVVHPQSPINPKPDNTCSWSSNLSIETDQLAWLKIFQINPSRKHVRSEVYLRDENGAILVNEAAIFSPRASKFIAIDQSKLVGSKRIRIGLVGLPGENCKPIVIFKNKYSGAISAVHS